MSTPNAAIASNDAEADVPASELGLAEPTVLEPTDLDRGFQTLGLCPAMISAVEIAGYSTPTPIQMQTIPPLLQGRDVLGQAQTGTGKTAAFALPLLERIDLSKKQAQVLVLTPTRELAIQVAESFEKYGKSLRGLRIVPIYGGQDYQIQLRQLDRGVQVVVGTPGRVMDHMRRGSLKLDELQCLVLDEADEMLRMGFAEDVDWVLTRAPEQRQMALFSATLPGPIRQIAQQHLTDPIEITIAQRTATADTVNQRYVIAAPHQKQATLARILEAEPTDGVLVFVKMRSTTEPLADFLAQAGLRTAALNGDVAQKQRERIVDCLRSGKVDVIVATDVAARGLDVQRISHVVNYDLPHDSEAYVHRIGRTGRAGRSGEAILFVHPRERRQLKRLEQATRQPIERMELPSNREINKLRVSRFHEKITEALASKELETFQSIVAHYQRENDTPLELIAAALAVLANGDTPLLARDDLKQVSFSGDTRGEARHHRATHGRKAVFQPIVAPVRGGMRQACRPIASRWAESTKSNQVTSLARLPTKPAWTAMRSARSRFSTISVRSIWRTAFLRKSLPSSTTLWSEAGNCICRGWMRLPLADPSPPVENALIAPVSQNPPSPNERKPTRCPQNNGRLSAAIRYAPNGSEIQR